MTIHTVLLFWSMPLLLAIVCSGICLLRGNDRMLAMAYSGFRNYLRLTIAAGLVMVIFYGQQGGCFA